jgi:hypothetical protein
MKANVLKRGVVFLSVLILLSSCNFFKTSSTKQKVAQVKDGISLKKNNWESAEYVVLNNLIMTYGKNSLNYKSTKRPYAVFDWDNTSIINDIEESVLLYQLENLRFMVTPEKLNEIIRKDIPEKNFVVKNVSGNSVNIDQIAQDIISDYSFLYRNYTRLQGIKKLPEIKKTLQYKDFVAKMRFLYEAIGETFSPDVSYPWVIYLFTGMNSNEVVKLTNDSIEYWTNKPMGTTIFTSPEKLPGKAGVVSVECHTGLRTIEEMKNLYSTLMGNGFDVYICSASFVDVVKTFASSHKYGYNIPKDHVIAMELERDKTGIIIDKYRSGYDQTQNMGKTKNIERFLVSKYGYGPILVGGDSDGDYDMLVHFKNTKVGLIIDRNKKGRIGELARIALETKGDKHVKYILQGRDENRGVFIPTSKSKLLASEKSKNNKSV